MSDQITCLHHQEVATLREALRRVQAVSDDLSGTADRTTRFAGVLTAWAISLRSAITGRPTCCERTYFCPQLDGYDCSRHGGFDVCCENPGVHRAER